MSPERLLIDSQLHFFEYNPPKKETFLFLNTLKIDTLREWVTLDGKRIMITGAALKILCALIRAKGELRAHHELYTVLFPTRPYNWRDHAVHVHIMSLRKKLGVDVILTTPRSGYKINLDYGRRIETKSIQAA